MFTNLEFFLLNYSKFVFTYEFTKTQTIHVLSLCYTEDIKKYGFGKILKQFIKDLNKLEPDEGVPIEIGEENFILRASIAAFCGDGLAVHDIFGLLGPSANKFCRMCLISRVDLHAGNLKAREERTRVLHREHIRKLERARTVLEVQTNRTESGLNNETILNSSKYFHTTENKIFDAIHNFLCGIVPMVLKLVIHHYVYVINFFNLSYLNEQIAAFQYGFAEKKNKPSPNFIDSNMRNIRDYSLNQKAIQVRAFPFIVDKKIPAKDQHMNLILVLLRIMEIVFAPKLTKSLLPYLKHLINEFFEIFQKLFPDVNCINKFYHHFHYPECMAWAGPLILYWCMRFEAKHGEIKERAQVVHNFKNCPKTLLRVCQCVRSAQWSGHDLKINSFNSEGGKSVEVEDTLSKQQLLELNYANNDLVFKVRSAKINGIQFRNELVVCMAAGNPSDEINLPQFVMIKEILILRENEIYLLCLPCETVNFDTDFNSFLIQNGYPNDPTVFISPRDLPIINPCLFGKIKRLMNCSLVYDTL